MGAKKKRPGDPLRIVIGGILSKKQPRNRVTTTKYNWLTFLPLNFYDQFRRAVYFYFLIITIISFFVNDTISPLVSLLPLLFVMVLTALKEGLEDLSRARSDKRFNTAKVVVTSGNDVPCDLVLLQSSGPEKNCFVITANLDGETNVKTIFAPSNYEFLPGNPSSSRGTIVCEKSTPDLYSFNGRIEMDSFDGTDEFGVLPLTIDNLLLRGVRVQGTDQVIGCAIYTGMQTKLQLNSRYTGNKSASSEVYINKFMVVLIVGMILVVTVLYLIQRHMESKIVPTIPYLGPPTNFNSAWKIFEDFLSFLLLFNYMVPISAYMNIEVYRVFGSYFMQHDLHLYDSESDQPCEVNTSNLNEELGQVNILFSDKTGTLTKNIMKFVKCYVSGRNFHLQGAKLLLPETGEQLDMASLGDLENTFLEALTVCHTVEVHKGLGESSSESLQSVVQRSLLINHGIVENYQASSPDEKALLEGCANLGIAFVGQKKNVLYIRKNFCGVEDSTFEDLRFERLHVLEFSSERKRMSIIVKDQTGSIWLYSKGAENVIFPRCKPSLQLDETNDQVTKYAKEGLRTLAVARRSLTEEEFSKFEAQYKHANTQLSNRKALIAKCYENVEIELDLLGCTALEDALQDEVDATLEALQRAGLKIWVLTGDKVETAVNISLACRHIPQNAKPHFIIQKTDKETLIRRLEEIKTKDPEVLVVDGTTIAALLTHLPQLFADLALRCRAVLCCRLSPLQKSEIVSLIKRRKKHITAAIGDGANDISMIQEAHIGIGIAGREGKQAARCADFSIGRFEMLRRLFLVHGHYNSQRLALMVLFYCYKNIIITGCMALFQVYDLFSATNVYNSLYLWLFDIVYISFSFTYLALTDKDYNEETLLRHPELYRKLAHNKQASMSVFGLWMLNGFVQCFTIFFFAYAVLNNENVVYSVGQTASFQTFGTMLITIIVIVGNLKLLLISRYMTHINIVLIFVSIAAFILTTFLYNLYKGGELYDVYNQFLASLPLWIYTIICSAACLLPDLVVKVIRDMRRKTYNGNETESDDKIYEHDGEKV
ncbi:phospholipid-transporting ATPase IF isoform X2 [Drosophila ananassae]|uniref:phospholipid-transporting ATPase IF isoform X2 n=1 Tax=Drosophila ananassae TaxID=7217 RepID=UPI0013A5EF3B|nr:phospholipid-transporting ATPase IF isoform X2 [Drosophila ananassae]